MTNKPFILGLGNDIIEIARIRKSIEQHAIHFLGKLFTKEEQAYCNRFADSAPHFAGRFAAKEAIAKAFGTGFGTDVSWCDIEILPDPFGKPIVHLSEALQQRFNYPTILLSISHCKEHATAVAIWH